jgi:hypothetical protein
MNASQIAKKVGADEDALVEIFERMGAFFRRLETYNEVISIPTNFFSALVQYCAILHNIAQDPKVTESWKVCKVNQLGPNFRNLYIFFSTSICKSASHSKCEKVKNRLQFILAMVQYLGIHIHQQLFDRARIYVMNVGPDSNRNFSCSLPTTRRCIGRVSSGSASTSITSTSELSPKGFNAGDTGDGS